MIGTIDVIVRTFSAFILLICITHILGKQTISKMTYHDYITSITIGSIAGNLTFNTSIRFSNYLTALIILCTFLFLATLVSLKNKKARAIFNGEPTVVIQDGKILEKNIEKLRISMDSFNQALRRRDIFDIDEVEFAIFEPDGHLSILKKPLYRFVTREDLGISSPSQSNFPIELIMDGQMVDKNITQNHLTKDWIVTEIERRGLKLADVSYCVRGTNGQLYFDLYKDQIKLPVDIEE
ncbi:DUF421 domain-containing protein [Gottfriedia sp. NPDC057991]|uniref:DUF421 domain-containing protein n=1 Tax=Gottfriedia sp. NPDC057991 TaxID=3346298 RepID=UPI0036DBC989